MPPRAAGGMSVRKACATLNFPNPPTASKDLKKRFVTLAKLHHPDLQDTEEAKAQATVRMASITDAYKLLKSLIENRTAGGQLGGSGKGKAGQAAAWETDAAGMNFVAPGISKSSGEMWLPWQKAAPSRVVDTEKVLEDSADFWSFKASVRRAEQRAAGAEAARAEPDASSSPKGGEEDGASKSQFSGSQYSSSHFKAQADMSKKIKGEGKRKSTIDLLTSYLRARAPGRILESIRYIITGR